MTITGTNEEAGVKNQHTEVLNKLAYDGDLTDEDKIYWFRLSLWQMQAQLDNLACKARKNKSGKVQLSSKTMQRMADFCKHRLEDVQRKERDR